MQYFVKSSEPQKQKTDCAIIPWLETSKVPAGLKALDKACGNAIKDAARRGDLSSKVGASTLLIGGANSPCKRILVVGCGKPESFDRKTFTKVTGIAAGALARTGAKDAVSYLSQALKSGRKEQAARRLAMDTVAAVEQATYRFDALKSKQHRQKPIALKRFGIAVSQSSERNAVSATLPQARAIAEGARLARDLGNMPSNRCTPRYLASVARKIAAKSKKASARILNPDEIKRLGMGALLSVAAGAVEPARLIVIQYRGTSAKTKPTVLVGKGITFDTGGISIKPGQGMDEMKFDMCGAAGVLGAMQATIELGLKKNVVAIVPACVNMPDGNATNPGDIVTTMSGQTVEILNTDAEGRLILCDALTYARRFKPDTIIDVATLTGACVVALGPFVSGLMTEDDKLAAGLLEAGELAGDQAWRLPLMKEYGEGLASNFADFANVAGREGGASIAASFLSRFTKDLRWAHLDVAGTAWKSGKEKGATGRPVGLLVQYLLNA
ncbi:MAG: leucyl aminopeptidase [Gammaproteobacteria bacterium]|nr:leucyl aminopeptidase [Gammaproteobacteria bacterium]